LCFTREISTPVTNILSDSYKLRIPKLQFWVVQAARVWHREQVDHFSAQAAASYFISPHKHPHYSPHRQLY